MKTLLYIKANAKKDEDSKSIRLGNHFVQEYKKRNPEDKIIILDLMKEDIHFLKEEEIELIFNKDKNLDHPILDYARQFAAADKYVIAEPMWNLSIPAILKAYIDYICVPGITFNYTGDGKFEGLLYDKKAINISSRGGIYGRGTGSSLEMGDAYLKKIFSLFGIIKYQTLYLDASDIDHIDQEIRLQQAMEDAGRRALIF